MSIRPQAFTPRQEMCTPDYELQHKQDAYLKDVALHHHDFYELYFLVSGDVTYTIESKLYHVRPGDILLISPNELHQVHIRPEMAVYQRYVLWVHPQLLQQLSTQETDLSHCFDSNRPGYRNQLRIPAEEQSRIRELMQSLYQEQNGQRFGADLLRTNLLTQILVTIGRYALHAEAYQDELSASSEMVSSVIAYINAHYSEALTLDNLAERFFVSKYHLSHEFNRLLGAGVHRYIQKKRLLIARQLMQQGMRPNHIWQSCGFGDYSSFFRAFKAEYGISPRDHFQNWH